MGWSEAGVVCGKHPEETPQPGICPSCLRERLSRIINGQYSTANYDYNITATSPSISAYDCGAYYTASSSVGSSPPRRHSRRHQRVASDIMDSIYVAFGAGNGLKKSRSMANYATRPRDDGVNHKKKRGFWNKLLLRSNAKKSKFW